MNNAPDRTESVFATALTLPIGEQAAYLDRACAGDSVLRRHVEALLRAHERAGHLLDRPVPGTLGQTVAYVPQEEPGVVIAGRYKLLEAIGEGGMGTVWLAEQTEPVRRKVALKLIKAGMDSKSVLARFEAERQALAMMDHPHIAKVLDGGLTELGRPYFVMEYVKGVPITEYCDATRLSVAERLQLFTQVCQAVQHAHQKGIIHRDLKPSNILVAPCDDKPVPKIIDFGLAKAMHHSLTERTLHTAHETVLGTPLYMSPEQAQLNNLDVDTRSDVYSLGVVLYEILTGTTPLEKRRFKETAWEEVRRIIREEEPPRPSARLSSTDTLPSLAACRHTEPRLLTREVRGDLDWIVMKALEKDRTRRYETASGFAMDLQRYLMGDAVQAHPPSATYRVIKLARRHKGQVIAASLVLLAVFGGVVGTSIGMVEAEKARSNEALRAVADNERQKRNAEAVAGLLDQAKEALQAGDATRAEGLLDAAAKRADEGGAEGVSGRRERLQADLAVLNDLDDLDRVRWSSENRKLSNGAMAARLREALSRFGLAPESVPEKEAAARVSGSAVRDRLVVALDQSMQLLTVENRPWVREVLRAADPDPYRDAVRDAELANDRAQLAHLAGQPQAADQSPGFVVFLGELEALPIERRRELLKLAAPQRAGNLRLLMALGGTYPFFERDAAEASLRWFQAAVAVAPGNSAARNNLGTALVNSRGHVDEAIAYFRKSIELDPQDAIPHLNLGQSLKEKGEWDASAASYRQALELNAKLAPAHDGLGVVLARMGQIDAAIASYQKALELDSQVANIHHNLGLELHRKGLLDEAIACYRKTIELDPQGAPAHTSLATALLQKGQFQQSPRNDAIEKRQWDDAMALYRKAVELDPKYAWGHVQLGNALENNRQVNAAIACYQRAIELDPKLPQAHGSLGRALEAKGQVDAAIACYRKTIELAPKLAPAHGILGQALTTKGQLDAAIASFRQAIELAPRLALPHYGMGVALFEKGQVAEAIACYSKALELEPNLAPARMALGQAQLLTPVQNKLPPFLIGDFKPTTIAERLGLAGWCKIRKLYRTATDLYAEAFAADPRLADDLSSGYRYTAASLAALAADGQGEESARLDDTEMARLRKLALDWLRADLALRTRQLASGQRADTAEVQQQMQRWQQNSDLAGIRDATALAKFPADERESLTQLWADVDDLQKKAAQSAK